MKLEEQKMAPLANKAMFPESCANAYNFFHKEKWLSWKYNEIIGFSNLYIMGLQLRGDA